MIEERVEFLLFVLAGLARVEVFVEEELILGA